MGSKLQHEDLVNDLEGVLEQMDLLEGPTEKRCIKNVAAMMFCEHPEKFFKTTQVDIVIFPEGRENNPDNIIELPTIKGSVPMMIRDAMSYLRTNVIKEHPKGDYSGLNVPPVAERNVPPVAERNVPINGVVLQKQEMITFA